MAGLAACEDAARPPALKASGLAKSWSAIAVAIAAALLAIAPLDALAEPAPALGGNWIFETDEATPRQCVITGEATLTPTQAGAYDIRLTTFENCRDGSSWRSQQRCAGVQKGRSLRIDCTIVTVTPDNYARDNFVLEAANANAMAGALVSVWSAPSRWRRTRGDLVS